MMASPFLMRDSKLSLSQFSYGETTTHIRVGLRPSAFKGRFSVKRQHDSHIVLRRNDSFAQLVVPDHKELDRGTLRAILRAADLTVEQFIDVLT